MFTSLTLSCWWALVGSSILEQADPDGNPLVDALLMKQTAALPLDPEQVIHACQQRLRSRRDLSRVQRASLWVECAKAHVDLKQFDKAHSAATEAQRLDPDGVYANYLYATLQTIQLKNPQPLMDHLRAHPDDSKALGMYAQLLTGNGQTEEALEVADKAVAAAGDEPEKLIGAEWARALAFQRRGDHRQVLTSVNRMIDLWPKAPAYKQLDQLYCLRAGVYRALGDKAATEADYGRALQLNSDNWDALRALVIVKCQQAQHHASLHLARHYAHMDKGSDLSVYVLAVAYFTAGRNKEAKQVLSNLSDDGDYPYWLWTLRGSVALMNGENQIAVGHYRRAIACGEDAPRAYLGLAFALSKIDNKNPEIKRSLAEGLKKYSSIFDTDVGGQVIRAMTLANLGEYQEAAIILRNLPLDELPLDYRTELKKAVDKFSQEESYEPESSHLRLLHTDA